MKYAPHGSETFRSVHGERVEWGYSEHLLADIFDLLATTLHQIQLNNRDPKKAKPKAPEPHHRPGVVTVKAKRRTQLSDREIARRLVAMSRLP